MPFMQKQVTRKQNWVRVETTQGTEFISIADTSLFVRNSETLTHPMSESARFDAVTEIQQYTDGEPESWENIQGYGARLSAPGYMDCTEWAVFDTGAEAWDYLEEMYPDENGEEEEG